ncbi:ParB N-terminal domain-containing protein [Desmospora profundinema]|uniref:ParB-like N-terminal domain-containing protein n=1 Tax=Desmospora profundinema TaxID=1571184 RepID=A0ABU1ILN6_9BACL|nr:ParB N-terminal domain-containing protein [Desmospora profundinema]MDR6225692.1 hypothetical protein [Desmospora profundinema]
MDILSSILIVSPERVINHEEHEPSRLQKISEVIQKENVLRHPILVTPISKDKYMTLDGTHRLESLKQLGCKYIPIQVVTQGDLKVDTWDHVVKNGKWLDDLVSECSTNPVELDEESPICIFKTDDGESIPVYYKTGEESMIGRLNFWRTIVENYSVDHAIERLPAHALSKPAQGKVLVRHYRLSLDEIVGILSMKETVPSGITRFVVSGRLLNICIPLDLLFSEVFPFHEWNKFKVECDKKLRFYSESIYLCE